MTFLSWVCGVTYAILFGGSLTFQVIVNYYNKSTKGYSTDYALTGFVGFFFLVLNQTIGMIDTTTDAGRVHTMDMFFSQAAFFCASCSYTQTMVYPSHKPLLSTRLTVGIVIAVFLMAAFLETVIGLPLKSYAFISLIDLAAFIKAGSSLVKYFFQIRENWINKSTEGLSKAAFVTDMLGGLFCFFQLQLDARIAGHAWFLVDPQLNTAKVLIATFGFVSTNIILIQMFCIYDGQKRQKMVHEDSEFDCSSYYRADTIVDDES